MSLDERRAALVEATIPLLHEHGAALTTKQVAEAAGIAEGTVFRAFSTKEDLVHACAEAVFDSAVAVRRLGEVDRDQPLDDRLADAVAVLLERLERIVGVIGALHQGGSGPDRHDGGRGPRGGGPGRPRLRDPELERAMVEVIGADAAELRLEPEDVVNILAHLTFSSAHPMFPVRAMTPPEIVSVVLDGVRRAG